MGKKGFLLPLLSVLVLASLISLPVARAQLSAMSMEIPTAEELMKYILEFLFGTEFPDEWLTWSGFMQNIIFPFIAVFVVMYGILSELRIFHNANVKAVLSLVMAFVGGTVVLQTMRAFLFANALWGTVGWGVLLIFGIGAWVVARGAEYYGWGNRALANAQVSTNRWNKRVMRLNNLEEEIIRDRANMVSAGNDKQQAKIWSDRLNADTAELNRLLKEEQSGA
jgi:hypothetical protein